MTGKVLKVTKAYKKDIKRLKRANKNFSELYIVLNYLKSGNPIPQEYNPHPLYGKLKGCMECHIESDWLLMWKEEPGTIKLIRTGSHSELFKK